ncbi:hypothetical protein ROHU_007150 [Labeo rohita]|uniref:Uncharacterized protein n=1 Tax=Labeo rohita TaxID=84645 RepID=A0A498MG77_LABRO|nr:hypothetical protein ROHU_007150 [Labeo rohita]
MEGSRCDRREPRLCCTGKESPTCHGVRSVTPNDGGIMLRPKGAAALLHRKGESPLRLNTKRGLMPRMEGSHCNRRGPAALLHREGEPRPTQSTQRNSRRRTEGSHCDRREPWPCCTRRGSPVRCWMCK